MMEMVDVPMAAEVPDHGSDPLAATGNEQALHKDAGVSLKATGNEVAIESSHDDRTLRQRWNEWSVLRSLSRDSLSSLPAGEWADECEILLIEWQAGILDDGAFGNEICRVIEEIFLLNGLVVESVQLTPPAR